MIYGLVCLDNFNRGKLIGESRAVPSRGVSHCVLKGSLALRACGELISSKGESRAAPTRGDVAVR